MTARAHLFQRTRFTARKCKRGAGSCGGSRRDDPRSAPATPQLTALSMAEACDRDETRRAQARPSSSGIQGRLIGTRAEEADVAKSGADIEPLWGAIEPACDVLCPPETGPVR